MTDQGFFITPCQVAVHFGISLPQVKEFVKEGRIEINGPVKISQTRYNLDSYRDTRDSPPRGQIERTTRYVKFSQAARYLNMTVAVFDHWSLKNNCRFVKVGKFDRKLVEWTAELDARCTELGNESPLARSNSLYTTNEACAYLSICRRQLGDVFAANCIQKITGERVNSTAYYDMTSLLSEPSGPAVPYEPAAHWCSAKQAPKEFGVTETQFSAWVAAGKIRIMVIGGIDLPRFDVDSFVPTDEDYMKPEEQERSDDVIPKVIVPENVRMWRGRIKEEPTTLPGALKQLKGVRHDLHGALKRLDAARDIIKNLQSELATSQSALQEEQRLRYEEKRQFDASRLDSADRKAIMANPSLLGAYGEKECRSIYEKAFASWGRVQYVSRDPHSGDFNQQGEGFLVIHELKYGKTLISARQGLIKLNNDIVSMEGRTGVPCVGATLVSWNSNIANQHEVPITTCMASNGRTLIVCINNMEKIIATGSRYVDVLKHARNLIIEHQKNIRRSVYFSAAMTLIRKREGARDLMISQISDRLGITEDSLHLRSMINQVVKMVREINSTDPGEIVRTLNDLIDVQVDSDMTRGLKHEDQVVLSPQIIEGERSRSRSRSRQVRIADVATVSDGTVRRMAEPASEEE